MSRSTCLASGLCFLFALHAGWQAVSAADWPQFRHDARRSAATDESLAADLHLQWVRQLPNPRPAFPDEIRLRFDASYEPVVRGKSLFVPSMVDDCLTAMDTDTGAVQWRFFAGGPMRFAPIAWKERVYVVSDDGYLYCLRADNGQLLWKFRGLPDNLADRWLLGQQRMISLWPARGGPVLHEGIIFFAAGIWPDDGVFVHAVDATSGESVWSNDDSNRIPRANMDHGVAQLAGLTPQGYLTVLGDHVVVPCGAQLPAFLNRHNGSLSEYSMGWGGRVGLPKGSWFVAGAGDYLSHSGDLYDISRANDEQFRDPRGRPDFKRLLYPGGFTRLLIDPGNQRALNSFSQPVITGDALYQADTKSHLVARDLTSVSLELRSTTTPTRFRENDQYPDKYQGKFSELWRFPTPLQVQLKAGDRLYLSGPQVVQAVDMGPRAKHPTVTWKATIDGTPHRMLAADGKLFVVTLEGHLYAFGPQQRQAVRHRLSSRRLSSQAIHLAATALQHTTQRSGYALVLGLDDGKLVEALLQDTEFYVVAVDSDEQTVSQLRNRLHQCGVYGRRLSVHLADPLTAPLPPLFASLVVSEDPAWCDRTAPNLLKQRLTRLLRPYGGVAFLTHEPGAESLRQIAANDRAGVEVQHTAEGTTIRRPGPLPDVADWSHAGGDAANSGGSQDRFLRAPLGLLWFDTSLRWDRKPGSADVRVATGRVIVRADRLYAVDVYTGRLLWQAELPGAKAENGELVVVEDEIFVAADSCHVLDAATGEIQTTLRAPSGLKGRWSNLRVGQDYLAATIGSELVCWNRQSGEVAWQFTCGRAKLSTAISGDTVYCAELANERRGETPHESHLRTRAFEINRGELRWETSNGAAIHCSTDQDLLVSAVAVFDARDGRRLREGVPAAQIVGGQLVSGTTDSFVVYDLQSGRPHGEELTWNRRGCTGLRSSCHLVTTRFKGNAAYVDLHSRNITPLWNIRSGCENNLFPANGVLNVPNVTGGCECNYTPTSKAFIPLALLER